MDSSIFVAGEMRFQSKRVSPRRSVFLHNHGWFKYSGREIGIKRKKAYNW